MHRRKLFSLLDHYAASHRGEADNTRRFIDFVVAYERCFDNDLWAGHVTGSAWVMDTAGARVLLTHHRKLGRWLQLGGHSDGDPDTLAVATREAEEESGLEVVLLDEGIFDLDIHGIPARRNDPAHYHFDVRFLFQAKADSFRISAESNELAWVPVTDVTKYTEDESVLRMRRKWFAFAAGNPERAGRVLGLDGG
jgi:8-oxo-dGTP pyrophosphatase MutT (NUDIX family)